MNQEKEEENKIDTRITKAEVVDLTEATTTSEVDFEMEETENHHTLSKVDIGDLIINSIKKTAMNTMDIDHKVMEVTKDTTTSIPITTENEYESVEQIVHKRNMYEYENNKPSYNPYHFPPSEGTENTY